MNGRLCCLRSVYERLMAASNESAIRIEDFLMSNVVILFIIGTWFQHRVDSVLYIYEYMYIRTSVFWTEHSWFC